MRASILIALSFLSACATSSTAARDPAAVQRSIDAIQKRPPDFSSLFQCDDGKSNRQGTVVLSMTVGGTGSVENVTRREGTDLPDEVVGCMTRASYWLKFPMPEVDHVTVRYTFLIGGQHHGTVSPLHDLRVDDYRGFSASRAP